MVNQRVRHYLHIEQLTERQVGVAVRGRNHHALLTALLLCLAGVLCIWPTYVWVIAAELIVYGLALRRAYKSLGGMNGDISGYCLTLAELGALGAMALL